MALGALEHVTLMTLSIEPSYCMHQVVYENLPWSRLQQVTEKNIHDISLGILL